MTQEEKAQAYDEALERAKKVHKYSNDIAEIKRMEHIFPKLRGSEDERIRKELAEFLKSASGGFLDTSIQCKTFGKWLAWLEKQGEQKSALDIEIPFRAKDSELQEAVYLIPEGFHAEIEGDKVVIKKGKQNLADKVEPKFKKGDWLCENEPNNYARFIQILEILNVQGKERYRISRDIHNDEDIVEFDFVEKYYHKFNIKDAKGSDVLSNGKMIVIFKQFEEPSYRQHIVAYIGLDNYGDIQIVNDTWTLGIDKAKPATKEQRQLLFQKMYEAGYTFDFEKKELKKIENEEYDGEDYGIDSLYHAQRILEKTLGSVDGYQTDDGILDHKCAITAIKKLYEQKPVKCIEFNNEFENQVSNLLVSVLNGEHEYNEGFVKYVAQSLLGYAKNELKPTGWSEVDEYMLNETIQHLEELIRIDKAKHLGCYIQYYQRDIDWLKSLKQKHTWKPSEEQISALDFAIDCTVYPEFQDKSKVLIELLEQLKKLTE